MRDGLADGVEVGELNVDSFKVVELAFPFVVSVDADRREMTEELAGIARCDAIRPDDDAIRDVVYGRREVARPVKEGEAERQARRPAVRVELASRARLDGWASMLMRGRDRGGEKSRGREVGGRLRTELDGR